MLTFKGYYIVHCMEIMKTSLDTRGATLFGYSIQFRKYSLTDLITVCSTVTRVFFIKTN